MERLTQIIKDQGLLQKGDTLPGGSDDTTEKYPDLFTELFKLYGPLPDRNSEEVSKFRNTPQTTFMSYADLNNVHIRTISIGDKIFSNEDYVYYGKITDIEYDENNELDMTTDESDIVHNELDVITLSELMAIIDRLQKYLKHVQA